MTKKEFLNAVSNGKEDIIQIFLDALATSKANYCVIGGLALNAYAEPVVSLDLDIIVAAGNTEDVCKTIEAYFKIERFAHSVNLRAHSKITSHFIRRCIPPGCVAKARNIQIFLHFRALPGGRLNA